MKKLDVNKYIISVNKDELISKYDDMMNIKNISTIDDIEMVSDGTIINITSLLHRGAYNYSQGNFAYSNFQPAIILYQNMLMMDTSKYLIDLNHLHT